MSGRSFLPAVFAAVLGLFVLAGVAPAVDRPAGSQAQPSAAARLDKHAARGLTCEVCHGSAKPSGPPPMSVCVGCHGSYAQLAEQTGNLVPNPHKSHMGELECGLCHKEHRPSILFCNTCHVFEMKVP
jgi:hypothetical protein